MTKMSLSRDEAGAAHRRPFVWRRGRMDRTACVGRGLRPARPGLDGRAAGWQGSCRPPTGSGAAARKGWAARSPGGQPVGLRPHAGLEARTGPVTRPPSSPGRAGGQVESLGRGVVLRGHGRRGWAGAGVLPPRLALPVSHSVLVPPFPQEKKAQAPTFLLCGRTKGSVRAVARRSRHVPWREPRGSSPRAGR